VPHNGEVYFTLANVNFFFGLLLALFLVSDPPRTQRQHVFDILLIALAALSGPFSLIYVPLFVWRAVRERIPALTVRALLISLAAAAHFLQVLGQRLPAKPSPMYLIPGDILNILGCASWTRC
jgi:hypothetical protein